MPSTSSRLEPDKIVLLQALAISGLGQLIREDGRGGLYSFMIPVDEARPSVTEIGWYETLHGRFMDDGDQLRPLEECAADVLEDLGRDSEGWCCRWISYGLPHPADKFVYMGLADSRGEWLGPYATEQGALEAARGEYE